MYNYAGLTVYINPTKGRLHQKLQTLSNVIPALNYHLSVGWGNTIEDELKVKGSYLHLRDNKNLSKPNRFELPVDTPEKYMQPTIEDVHVKDKQNNHIVLNKIYVPIVSDDLEDVGNYCAALIAVVYELFMGEIVSAKIKHGVSTENFHSLPTINLTSKQDNNNQFTN